MPITGILSIPAETAEMFAKNNPFDSCLLINLAETYHNNADCYAKTMDCLKHAGFTIPGRLRRPDEIQVILHPKNTVLQNLYNELRSIHSACRLHIQA